MQCTRANLYHIKYISFLLQENYSYFVDVINFSRRSLDNYLHLGLDRYYLLHVLVQHPCYKFTRVMAVIM